MFIPILLSIGLAAIHYYSEFIHETCKKRISTPLISFAAGVSVAYLFLYLLNELTNGLQYLGNFVFIFLLAGFTVLHVVEKYIYQHERGRKRAQDLNWAHTFAFFVYSIIVGIVLVRLSNLDVMEALLFFVPIGIHSAVSSFSLREVHSARKHPNVFRTLLSSSPVLGAILGLTIPVFGHYFYALFGFLGGMLLYIVIRDSIPKGTQGKPSYFLLGVILYVAILVVTRGI